MIIKHIIATRFNLKIWAKDKSNNTTLDENWLKQRFELFDTFCFPSIFSQTDKNFIWLCFFDSDTPENNKSKIERYQLKMPQFKPVFLSIADNDKNYNTIIIKTIAAQVELKDDKIITTRLDNDDSLNIDFVRSLNETARNTTDIDLFCVHSFGYQYFISKNLLTKIKYPTNHFTSRIEQNSTEIKTVFTIRHSHIRKKSVTSKTNVLQINNSNNPFWIEVVHDRNVANDLYIAFRIRDILNFLHTRAEVKNRKLSEFGLDVEISKSNQLKQYFLFHVPKVLSTLNSKIIGAFR